MQVKEVMITDVYKVSPEDYVLEAAKIMVEKKVSSLMVCDGENIVGIITHEDVLKLVAKEEALKVNISSVMTGKVISISPSMELEEAADLMVKNRIKKLPVVIQGKLVGMVTASDLIKYEKSLIEKLSQIFLLSSGPGRAVAG